MSASHGSGSWIDEWFMFLVICFGLTFLAVLVTFAPIQ